jgi:LPXTG-site transpeptidase (sortase) family protein
MKINKKIPLLLITLMLLISLPSQVFALTWITPAQTLDSTGNVGMDTSLAVVNGYPAISFFDSSNADLKFIRAVNADGTSWNTPITLVSEGYVGQDSSLAVVNGNPAISYYDFTNADLKFIRAGNANGTTWNTSITLDSSGWVGEDSSLAVANGNPAISYYDSTNRDLKYIRATNASGTSWATPQTLDSSGYVGSDTSLAIVNGYPAISYYDQTNGDLKFIRATNASGTSWATPQTLDSSGTVGEYTSLAIVNGYPAISYYNHSNGDLKFIRATNANGTSWNTPQTLDSAGYVGQYNALMVVNGVPTISYYDFSNDYLKLIQAADVSGASWESPQILDNAGNVGEYTSLTDLNGIPAISYYDSSNGDLKFFNLSEVDITISNGAVSINNGDTLNFGTTTLNNPITIPLSINNAGNATVDLTNLSLPAGFSLTGNYSDMVAAGSNENIQIRLDALQTGAFSGDLQIGSTDTNQSPYTILLEGTVTEPHGEIAVFDGATEISDGTSDIFDIGTTTVGTSISHTFTVENSSTEDLNLYSLSLPSGFSLQGTYDYIVASGATTNITVRLDAILVGSYSGDFSLANDDADENPFNFTISGEVLDTSGEIVVLDGLTGITDGESTPIDFGDTIIGTQVSRTFTIQNHGVNNLDLYALTLPNGFSLQGTYNHVVAPGTSTDITVQLDAQFVGSYSGEFSLSSDDTDENPFNFAIEGNVLSADGEIAVFDGATEILDGTGSVDYGSTTQGTPLSRTFTIRNSSTEVLDLYALTLPSGFSLQGSYDHTVASGASTTITIQLDGQIVGSYSGDFSLANDDADEDPFNFTISGEVINTALETGIIAPLNGSTVLESPLQVAFNHDVLHNGSAEAADNPINYLLVEDGTNGLFETATCLAGVAGDDVQQTINSVTYNTGTFIATINTDPLPAGHYQLLVCGTASIEDLSGNVLNGGAFDSVTAFTVVSASGSGSGSTAATAYLPATGFTPGTQTSLPAQPAHLAYSDMDSLRLQIPSLKVDVPIVGVPQTANGWDVTWLTNGQAGWLNGSAYPTWDGNTVLTGHVTNASGNPGPFAEIKTLKFGDQLTIQAYGETYTYEVRENKLVTSDDMSIIEEHKSRDWITLITCEYFNETTGQYLYRRVVRAVLVVVE